ncbi:single-stranded-DNA-specific exonuclease RecJ [Pedobacter faecalis]|uniref:single-stranded-DNA-specific exonuclease RecJ n=1 Tax=Pedobacter faecalis TaxID=3041495 RepID=UPI00254AADDB|nr:single-stranded-DNA-specific exonuclease RecJ [Pedobacter sp. ELA7]
MEKRWVRAANADTTLSKSLAQELNIDDSLAQVLVQRGVTTFEEARSYFKPELSRLHDPFLMRQMDQAVNRIDLALASSEKILVYGDYDVDGTTAVALVYSFLSGLTQHVDYYIPDRHKEGYGISTAGIDYASAKGFSLIIALDCGIKSVDKIDYANKLGIDFIVCDHHTPGEELPDAIAVLDPKRADCNYPFKELSGCGIGFKLAQAYSLRHGLPESRYLCYLDLVMVSIAADIVPIVGENRVLAHHGLLRLNDDPCTGLKALMEVSGRPKPFTITDVVFSLAPRINAAGRMDHGRHAVDMLICTEETTARERSQFIDSHNADRKNSDKSITAEALELIADCQILTSKKTTVVYNQAWNKGVIGIVASRLIENYYRPTIVLTASNGMLTGSARSVEGFDLYEALLRCEDLLEQFGGHKFAAGLTLRPEKMQAFSERFEEVVSQTITESMLCPELKIDAQISFSQITPKFQRIIGRMEPFGPHNPAPLFMTNQVYIVYPPKVVGTKHLKLTLKQQNSIIFEGIAFGLAGYEHILQPNQPFSVCYTIEENVWRGERRLQLNIKAIKMDNHNLDDITS